MRTLWWGVSQCRKNWNGALWNFSTSIQSQNSKKNWRGEGPFGEFFLKKVTMPKKTERGDPLVSPGIVCYVEKKGKLFSFSSLSQHVQFGPSFKFCRTFDRTILVTSGVSKKHRRKAMTIAFCSWCAFSCQTLFHMITLWIWFNK